MGLEKMEIEARIIIELLGKPKEHIEETMDKVLDELKSRKNVEILNKETSEAKELEKFYSIFSELEIKCDDISNLFGVCFDFMPSSVEILKPSNLTFESKKMDDFLNDLLAKLHQESMVVRNLHAENILMKQKLERK